MRVTTEHHIEVDGRRIGYRVVQSKVARGLRLRVGPRGVEVIQPIERSKADITAFLRRNQEWLQDQLQRVARLDGLRRPEKIKVGEILFRGNPVLLRIDISNVGARVNRVEATDDGIVVRQGGRSGTPAARSLENWLRSQARVAIKDQLAAVATRLRVHPGRVYVMGQRTKWGNCSPQGNLSFNWRLILAPEYVLRYIVTHEAAHLAIPDHSARFWLAVQSLCPVAQRAKQWLSRHGSELTVDYASILKA